MPCDSCRHTEISHLACSAFKGSHLLRSSLDRVRCLTSLLSRANPGYPWPANASPIMLKISVERAACTKVSQNRVCLHAADSHVSPRWKTQFSSHRMTGVSLSKDATSNPGLHTPGLSRRYLCVN
jgi:hypothetical protein